MLNESTPNAITRLYRSCNPNVSLHIDDERYVNCDAVRGSNLVEKYAWSLRRSDPTESEVKIFAGHRGVGKTSELRRLQNLLETPDRPEPGSGMTGEKPFCVVFSDVGTTLDLNDLDFPDLLAFLAAELQQKLAAAKIPGFSATSDYLRRTWDDLLETLGSEVVLKNVKTSVPYADLAIEIKNRPGSRSLLREAIERQSTHLIEAVNDLLRTATVRLREAGYEGLVLIVDGLDKLVLRPLDDGDTHERLFIRRSEQMASLAAHVIYTVPISLIYSPQFTQLVQTFGEFQTPVPMLRLRENQNFSTDSPGMQVLREIIRARCRHAKVDFEEVFDSPETCDRLCESTGGHPRHLMMFLQAAINGVDALPLTREAVDGAIRNYANSLLRSIPDGYWKKLRHFKKPKTTISKDPEHQEMLFLLYIFEYMNGRPWYEVNPVIRELETFRG